MILKKLNKESYNYFSIPAVVNLSGAMNENYESFMKQFLRPLKVSGLPSAYALLKLSMYMAENSDLCGAAKIAEIAESFKADKDMHEIAEENSIKLNWLCSNFREVLEKTKINPN